MNPDLLKIYLVTDPVFKLGGRSVFEIVERACAAGVTIVQYRDKDCDRDAFVRTGSEIRRITSSYGVPLVINDRVDTVAEIDADGVHVGQGDMSVLDARRILGLDAIVGVSVFDARQAQTAERHGASYVAVNGVFPTGTKDLVAGPVGLNAVTDVSRSVGVPVIGIGGINAGNAYDVIRSGAVGVAVITAITMQDDIESAVEAMSKAVRGDV